MLGTAGTVAAEDTRTARHLLTHFGITSELLSYTEHNRNARIPQILRLLETRDVALVSEAGTPAISDPGQELVSAAIATGYPVVAIPGASAVLTALAVSGLSTRQFLYLGFLPRKQGDRRALLGDVAGEPRTLVCFEAPSRLRTSLADMLACLGDRRAVLCRELTKLHEETLRGTLSLLLDQHARPRGEYTVVIDGAIQAQTSELDGSAIARLRELQSQGASAREATAMLAEERRLPRRRVYEAWLKLTDGGSRDGPMVE